MRWIFANGQAILSYDQCLVSKTVKFFKRCQNILSCWNRFMYAGAVCISKQFLCIEPTRTGHDIRPSTTFSKLIYSHKRERFTGMLTDHMPGMRFRKKAVCQVFVKFYCFAKLEFSEVCQSCVVASNTCNLKWHPIDQSLFNQFSLQILRSRHLILLCWQTVDFCQMF